MSALNFFQFLCVIVIYCNCPSISHVNRNHIVDQAVHFNEIDQMLPKSDVLSQCELTLRALGVSIQNFTDCLLKYSLNSTVCQKCFQQYNDVRLINTTNFTVLFFSFFGRLTFTNHT